MRNLEIQQRADTYRNRVVEAMLSPEDRLLGHKLLIPKPYLFGTQDRGDYSRTTEHWVKDLQKDKWGMFYLLQHPAIIVALPEENGMGLYISDGHHRVRYGARLEVPSLVFPERTALYITNKWNRKIGKELITLDELKDELVSSSRSAIDSFSLSLPENKYPAVVRDVRNFQELTQHPHLKPY